MLLFQITPDELKEISYSPVKQVLSEVKEEFRSESRSPYYIETSGLKAS